MFRFSGNILKNISKNEGSQDKNDVNDDELSSDDDYNSDAENEKKVVNLQKSLYWKNLKAQLLSKLGFDTRSAEEKVDDVTFPAQYW